jgi:hypothetical protein
LPPLIWNGTSAEGRELTNAINRNCTCGPYGMLGVRASTCAAHEAFLSEQRFLDGLLWMRRLKDRINAEEHGTEATPQPAPGEET